MGNSEHYQKHLQNVRNETDNPAILNDVVSSEFEQYPGHNEKRTKDRPLTQVQEVARDNIDGKTWQSLDD